MFKKTLLCAALIAVSGGATAKAVGTSSALIHGTEGSMDVVSINTSAAVMTLGASYTQGDTVTLTWSQPLVAGTGHTALAIKDTETFTSAATNDTFVTAMNPNAAGLAVVDNKGNSITVAQAAVTSLTTAAGLAAAINAVGGTFTMTASGTNAGGLVLTDDTTGAGTQAAIIFYSGTGSVSFVEKSSLSIPLTVLSTTASSVTYRAGAVPAAFSYGLPNAIAIAAKPITGSNQASGTLVGLGYAAATSTGTAIDSGTVSTVVAEFWDQYVVKATVKADAQIDVENLRKQFSAVVPSSHAIDQDIITVLTSTAASYTNALVGETAGNVAALTGGLANTITISSDFSWLDSAAAGFAVDATVGTLKDAAAGSNLTGAGVTATAVTQNSTVAAPTATLAIGTTKTTVLTAKTYTASTVLKWVNSAAAVTAKTKTFSAAAGSWVLNGSTITAYGIPNQAAVTPFLWVQNAGTGSGEITGSASCDGATIALGSLGTAAGDTNTTIGALVQSKVDAAGTCAVGSRYDAKITVNAKNTDITLNAGYRVTAADGSNDRLSLETSDSLN